MRPYFDLQWSAATFVVGLRFIAVSANTEIVNIVARETDDVSLSQTSNWPVLSSVSPDLEWAIQPAPLHTNCSKNCFEWDADSTTHEKWVVLDMDSPSWGSFSRFTVRISWPAFHPTDFYTQIFSPEAVQLLLIDNNVQPRSSQPMSGKTRRQYARIRLVNTGVRESSKTFALIEPTPFIIILEPLYLGVLPASVLPVLLYLVPVVLFSLYFVVPRIHTYLRNVADEIQSESEAPYALARKQD